MPKDGMFSGLLLNVELWVIICFRRGEKDIFTLLGLYAS
jgi:hypothetical protein